MYLYANCFWGDKCHRQAGGEEKSLSTGAVSVISTCIRCISQFQTEKNVFAWFTVATSPMRFSSSHSTSSQQLAKQNPSSVKYTLDGTAGPHLRISGAWLDRLMWLGGWGASVWASIPCHMTSLKSFPTCLPGLWRLPGLWLNNKRTTKTFQSVLSFWFFSFFLMLPSIRLSTSPDSLQ